MEKKEEFKLELFGKILSEPGRIKILEYIRDHGSATVSDINHIFGFGGTTSYYHLSMIQKAGMITTETKGRSIHYFINKQFFTIIDSYNRSYIN